MVLENLFIVADDKEMAITADQITIFIPLIIRQRGNIPIFILDVSHFSRIEQLILQDQKRIFWKNFIFDFFFEIGNSGGRDP